MAYEFRFPDIGEGITEGELLAWKVKEGDMSPRIRLWPRWRPTRRWSRCRHRAPAG